MDKLRLLSATLAVLLITGGCNESTISEARRQSLVEQVSMSGHIMGLLYAVIVLLGILLAIAIFALSRQQGGGS